MCYTTTCNSRKVQNKNVTEFLGLTLISDASDSEGVNAEEKLMILRGRVGRGLQLACMNSRITVCLCMRAHVCVHARV